MYLIYYIKILVMNIHDNCIQTYTLDICLLCLYILPKYCQVSFLLTQKTFRVWLIFAKYLTANYYMAIIFVNLKCKKKHMQ